MRICCLLHIIYIHLLYLADGSKAFVFFFFFFPFLSYRFVRDWSVFKADNSNLSKTDENTFLSAVAGNFQ